PFCRLPSTSVQVCFPLKIPRVKYQLRPGLSENSVTPEGVSWRFSVRHPLTCQHSRKRAFAPRSRQRSRTNSLMDVALSGAKRRVEREAVTNTFVAVADECC